MARAARTVSVILAVLGAIALAPSVAAATVAGETDVSLPPSVTVGQTGVPLTITLTNANSDEDAMLPNSVCNYGDGGPCPEQGKGIWLLPACSQLISDVDDCVPGEAEPDVFAIDPVATGEADSSCPDTIFDVAVADPDTGAVRFTPRSNGVMLPSAGSACRIDATLAVTAMPAGDLHDDVPGVQTGQIASADQISQLTFYRGRLAPTGRSSNTATSETTVYPATPAIAASASGNVVIGSGALSDQATVSGRVNPVAGATVSFRLYGPGDATCATPIFATSSPLSDAGTAASAPFTPPRAGVYRWVATYGGDANNAPAGGACNDPGQTVSVAAVTPSVTAAASPGGLLGTRISAGATVGGRALPIPGSTVSFSLYGPDADACTNPIFVAAAPVNGAGAAASPPFAPTIAGVYRWVATYSGDANNVGGSSGCGAAGTAVTIAPLPARVLSAGFASTPRVGRPAFLTVGAYDPTRPIAGIQAQFGESHGLSGVSACRLGSLGVAVSPVRLRLPYTFRKRGKHKIKIVVLAGGCNAKQHRTVSTIDVDVAAGTTTRSTYGAAPVAGGQIARAAASSCSNSFLRPTTALARAKVATAVLCLVNVERAKLKLKKLKRSSHLAAAALGHSKDMLKRHFFDHAGPGGPSFQARLTRIHYRGSSAAENIGYGSNFNAKLIVQAWMNSPPHRANILYPRSKFAGIGIAVGIPVTPQKPGSTYTMDFGSALK